jgi:cell division protein FtsW
MLTLKKDQVAEKSTFFSLLAYIVLVVFFVLPENFSTAALIFISCYFMLFFGGVDRRWWWRIMIALVAMTAIGLAIAVNRYKSNETGGAEKVKSEQLMERSSTWGHRLQSYFDDADPTVITQENDARIAVARGGVFGVGPGNTLYARLMTQSHNDFIYAIIIEESGLVGGVLVLILYSFFYFRCVRLAWRCKGRFGALTVAGLGTMIYLQALANMGVAVGVLPVTGQTLPFISYGGTAYLFLSLGMGIIQSVAADVYTEPRPAVADKTALDTPDTDIPENEMIITDDTQINNQAI